MEPRRMTTRTGSSTGETQQESTSSGTKRRQMDSSTQLKEENVKRHKQNGHTVNNTHKVNLNGHKSNAINAINMDNDNGHKCNNRNNLNDNGRMDVSLAMLSSCDNSEESPVRGGPQDNMRTEWHTSDVLFRSFTISGQEKTEISLEKNSMETNDTPGSLEELRLLEIKEEERRKNDQKEKQRQRQRRYRHNLKLRQQRIALSQQIEEQNQDYDNFQSWLDQKQALAPQFPIPDTSSTTTSTTTTTTTTRQQPPHVQYTNLSLSSISSFSSSVTAKHTPQMPLSSAPMTSMSPMNAPMASMVPMTPMHEQYSYPSPRSNERIHHSPMDQLPAHPNAHHHPQREVKPVYYPLSTSPPPLSRLHSNRVSPTRTTPEFHRPPAMATVAEDLFASCEHLPPLHQMLGVMTQLERHSPPASRSSAFASVQSGINGKRRMEETQPHIKSQSPLDIGKPQLAFPKTSYKKISVPNLW